MTYDQEALTQMTRNIKRPQVHENIENNASEEEIERRLKIAKELESLGISTSRFSTDNECEDDDILNAIILANEGKEIPEELKERLRKKNLEESSDDVLQ